VLIYFSAFYQRQLSVVTATHEKKEIRLSDGSRIWLNENSMLQYPEKFTGNLREVQLQGEAFFEIARDENQPFLVNTGNSVTKVLGTSFNIRQSADKTIEIDVVTGKVLFYNQQAEAKSIILQAGEEGLLATSALAPQKGVNKDTNFLSWHTGLLVFKNVALQEVIPQIEKYYQIRLILENKSLNQCFLTSSFDKRTLEEVLQTLQTIYGLRYQITGNTIYLRDGDC
jgi:ferric-dicitrate binding protein FerR (iron transport regulator)